MKLFLLEPGQLVLPVIPLTWSSTSPSKQVFSAHLTEIPEHPRSQVPRRHLQAITPSDFMSSRYDDRDRSHEDDSRRKVTPHGYVYHPCSPKGRSLASEAQQRAIFFAQKMFS